MDGRKTSAELAQDLQIDPALLDRLYRALAKGS
jgi:hypothetical protein